MTRSRLKVAFPFIGRGGWTGGFIYLKNTLGLIRSRLGSDIEASVFLTPAEHEKYGAELRGLVEGRLIVDPAIRDDFGRGRSLAGALLTGRDAGLERVLRAARIDAAFEVGSYCGARFGIPMISWIPDLQHRYMPEMFTRFNWWRRDLGFRMQTRRDRTIMVSSETARRDLERFYPSARGRVHVVRFAIDLDIAAYMGRGPELSALYGLPERFFFLPNQFWLHKNHALIVAALSQLKAQGALGDTLPVILSGFNNSARNPGHFDGLFSAAREAHVDSHFRHLGLIPYDHVLGLAACCDALINPSNFEGWSTPIEEAKAVGAPLLLSDIPIHREQAPGARFFNPKSHDEAAAALMQSSRQPRVPRAPLDVLVAEQNRRLDAHAEMLLAVVTAAVRGSRSMSTGARSVAGSGGPSGVLRPE